MSVIFLRILSQMDGFSMKRILVSLVFLLSACVMSGPVAVVYRPGSTGEQRSNDFTNCEVSALREVPRATATGVTPSYSTPSNVQCYGSGNYVNCQEYGGQTYGGNVYSYDSNQDLRDRVTLQCLQSKGYQVVSLPVCNAEQTARAVSAAGRQQPTVDKIECVTEDGYAVRQ
jgi:hypothetical protein